MILDRRNLLVGAGSVAALGIAGMASAARLPLIGLQLFTVRELFQTDPVRTLEVVVRIGYREVEFGGGGYGSMDHRMLRRTMDRLGLRAPSVHIGYDLLLRRFDSSVAMAKTLGADTVVMPYMAAEHRNEANWQAALLNFNRFAEDLKKVGLGFAYHNHDFEFTNKHAGVSLFDRFLDQTDASLVKVELDLYWIKHAGIEPAELIDRIGRRVYAFHIKDTGSDGRMTAIGLGTTDFGALFKRKASSGVRHFYVENDQAPTPYLPDITTSFQTLRALRF